MSNKRPVYLDHNATTPVDPTVLEEMLPYFNERMGNPSSIDHYYGSEANRAVETARRSVSELINCKPPEIVFTSGASEADNLAILGHLLTLGASGKHVITVSTEHKAVLKPMELLQSLGTEITVLPVDEYGLASASELESAIKANTVLVSIMTANNEIGTIAPIKELVDVTHEHNVLFHTDAAQAVGHITVDMKKTDVDMLSLSAHKMYGPKGIGALIVRRRNPRIKLQPIIMGGGHERGLRAGTLNVPSIVGLGAAAVVAKERYKDEAIRLNSWCNRVFRHLRERLGDVEINGHPENRLPHNLNLYIPGVQNKALQHSLKGEFAFSTGSACETSKVQSSHVLLAIGCNEERISSSIRLGFGRFNTNNEVEMVAKRLVEESERLRKLSR